MNSNTQQKIIDELTEECSDFKDNIKYHEFLIKTINQLKSIFDTIELSSRYATTEMSFEEYCKENYNLTSKQKARTQKAYRSQKYRCECGDVIKLISKRTHLKSKRHLDNLEIKKN